MTNKGKIPSYSQNIHSQSGNQAHRAQFSSLVVMR